MGDDRPSCYYEGDTLIIRASAIGSSCLWELVAAGQGYEPTAVPDFLQRAFDDGNRLEPIIVGKLEEAGYRIFGKQDEGHLVVNESPPILIRYHPDGLTYWKESATVVEIKAIADAGWQKAARYSVGDYIAEYKWQLSCMMLAEQLPAVWVAYNKGISDGTPCPDQGRLLFETVHHPPISFQEIQQKALLIKELIDGEDIMVSGRDCDDPNHFPCRYLHLRPESNEGWLSNMAEDNENSPPESSIEMIDATLAIDSEDSKKEVDFLIREYIMNKGIADEAKDKQDAARDKIIELSRMHKKVLTDKFLLTIVKGKNTTPDWASMPEELKAEVNKYQKTSEYRYIYHGIKHLGE